MKGITADYEFKIQQEKLRQQERMAQEKKKRADNLQLLLIAIMLIASCITIIFVRRKIPARTLNILTFIAFMVLFEYLVVLIDPSPQSISGNAPILLLIGNVLIAVIIAPLHHLIDKKFRRTLQLNEAR